MSRADELRLELAVAELEERLSALKPARERCEACGRSKRGEVSDELAAVKEQVAAARKAHREAREAR